MLSLVVHSHPEPEEQIGYKKDVTNNLHKHPRLHLIHGKKILGGLDR